MHGIKYVLESDDNHLRIWHLQFEWIEAGKKGEGKWKHPTCNAEWTHHWWFIP
jgi:hypothetical protein